MLTLGRAGPGRRGSYRVKAHLPHEVASVGTSALNKGLKRKEAASPAAF